MRLGTEAPLDHHGVVAIAQGHRFDPAIGIAETLFAALDGLAVGRKFDAGDVFLDQGMRGRLANEDEMPVDGAHSRADRLAGEQVVTEIDRIEPGVTGAVSREPTPSGTALAILFLAAIVRGNELRRQREHAVVTGATTVAERKLWKYSVLPPARARLEQWAQ